MTLKFRENLRKCLEIFGKFRKQFKIIFQEFLSQVFKIFGKSAKVSEVFINHRKIGTARKQLQYFPERTPTQLAVAHT